MTIKCVVTGHDAKGNACVISSGPLPNNEPFVHTPGFGAALFWKTPANVQVGMVEHNPLAHVTSVLPETGGTCAMLVTFPPETDTPPSAAQMQAAAEEMEQRLPGFLQHFEPDNPGFHTTNTVDYGIVLEGCMELHLDNQTTRFNTGDIVIQNGTRHAWRNTGSTPARMLFIMVDAQRATPE